MYIHICICTCCAFAKRYTCRYPFRLTATSLTLSSEAAFVLKWAQVEEWPMLCELLDTAAMDSTVYNAFSTLLGSLDVRREKTQRAATEVQK